MAFKLRVLRASSQAAATYLGAKGQLLLDTTNNRLYVHDGVTIGGHLLGISADLVNSMIDTALADVRAENADALIKLEGVEAEATKNSPDSHLLDRANHTGTQSADTIVGLGSGAFFAAENFPLLNLSPDSGRFAGKVDPLSLKLTGAFAATGFLNNYNGGTCVSAGKFIHDNTTYGGSLGTLTPAVISLLQAMDLSNEDARYGAEYYVAEFKQGTGAKNPNELTDGSAVYLVTVNNSRLLFGFDTAGTFTCWIRRISGSVGVDQAHYKNDVLTERGTPITQEWVMLRCTGYQPRGYDNAFPKIYASPGAVFQIALPAFFNGDVNPGFYTSPIPTINELSA